MINAIITGLFKLVMMIFNAITTPLFSFIFALFPDLANFFSYISQYITMSITYIGAASGLLLITNTMFISLFDYFVIKYSIYLGLKAYKLFINIYNKFKI